MSGFPPVGRGTEPANDVLFMYAFDFPVLGTETKLPAFVRYFSLLIDSFLRSNRHTFVRFKVSDIRFVLMIMSKGLSVARLGERLTSTSHGFKSLSTRMSKPKTSKQLLRYIWFFFMFCVTYLSPHKRVFMITSYVLDHKRSMSIPTCSK